MNRMLNFLNNTRKCVNTMNKTCIVIGNESCDLDSAVSAIGLAFFYQEHRKCGIKHTEAEYFLPVLNIPRNDYPLKTEVTYLLQKYAITAENLTFFNELQESFIANSDFILVDHHVSPFVSHTVEVFDHRPFNATISFPFLSKLNLELVGSCATLIAEVILEQIKPSSNLEHYSDVLAMLRSAIILDTVNFSDMAKRATPKDYLICNAIENALNITAIEENREEIFKELCAARADISHLTALQLLHKDLKVVTALSFEANIAVPGFPLSVQAFIKLPGASEAIQRIAEETKSFAVVLVGMVVGDDGHVEREIGFINIDKPESSEVILGKLLSASKPELKLQTCEDCEFMNGHFYKQANITATRKHIIPILQNALEHSNIQ